MLIFLQSAIYFTSPVAKVLDNTMHLQFIVFFMGILPAYLCEQNNINQTVQYSTQLNQTRRQEQEPLDDSSNPNYSCTNNKVLLDTLNILKENIIEDVDLTLSPNKFKQVLDTTIHYLKSAHENAVDTEINHASDLKRVIENFSHRAKKEALRTYPQFGLSPKTLKGRIILQYELPTTNQPECQTLFKAIVNAINIAYLQLNNFCLESGKCYAQNEYISSPLNLPRPMPGNIFPQIENLPSNQMPNRSNIIDLLGSYPENADFMTLLQNYRPNTEKAIKGNIWSISADNNIPSAPASIQGNLFNPIKDNMSNGGKDPDPLAILQSFKPKYNDMIKNNGLPIQELQLNSYGVPQNGNSWALFEHFKPNASLITHFEPLGNNGNNGDSNGRWNDLTRDQNVMEVLTVLNRPTGYIGSQSSLSQPNGALNFENLPSLVNNYTAQIPQSQFTPQFNIKPVDNFEVINNNLSEFTANIPWENKLRLNEHVQNFPYNHYRNLPTFQEISVPYKTTQQNFGGVPNFQDNGFNIKSPMNIENDLYYPNSGGNYLNHNYFNQIRQYYPDAAYNANINLPNSNTVLNKQVPNAQYSNWYQNQKVSNNVQYPMEYIPSYSTFGPNQFPHNKRRPMATDYIFANHLQGNISKQLSDLYRLTNDAKFNIALNKNGIVELTFTLQRPQSLVYKPLYYVKYRLPYQTYMYNVQNLLQRKPLLRNNPANLYKKLLDIANISESSQDLKNLAKEEISKLVATNGALVKAKVLDEPSYNNFDIEDDVNNVLHLASNLNPEEMLNATKKALNNVEEVLNTAVSKTAVLVNETSNEIPVKVLNTRSIRYPFYPQINGGYVPPININGRYMGIHPYNMRNKIVSPRLLG